MRTTVNLPFAVHQAAVKLAERRGQSMSAVVAELATRGLAALDHPVRVSVDPESGFPTIALGRPITSEDVKRALDDE